MSVFDQEIKKTIKEINSIRDKGDLCFCMLTDTHLSDQGNETRSNISAVDQAVRFDFIVHLGNLVNGDNPEKITKRLYSMETEKYQNAIKSRKLFLCQGDTDGWRDERFAGQLAAGIISDQDWYAMTSFINLTNGIARERNRPYYYVDIPEFRLVFLCTYSSWLDRKGEFFEKRLMISVDEQKWLRDVALSDCENRTVLLFSHRIPRSRFETGTDPYAYEGRHTEPVAAVLQQAQRKGTEIACWFGGGYGCDAEIELSGQRYAVIASQLPKPAEKAKCSDVRLYHDRSVGTNQQDLWDAVVVKKEERKAYLIRFGCGENRVICF